MKKLLLAAGLLLAIVPLNINAQQLPQEWLNSFRPLGKCADRLSKIKVDSAGNIYTAGYAGGERGTPDAFVMKLNVLGDTLWTWYYHEGSFGEDYVYDFDIDATGNVYVTGASDGTFYNPDCFTAKISNTGVQQWLTRYPSASNSESQGTAIAVDATGNVYVAGFIDPPSASPNWLVLKYNSTGAQQWVDLYNGPLNAEDKATDIVIAPNGNPTVCGYHWDSTALGGVNTLVRQYNTTGGVAWQSTYTNPTVNGFDQAFKLSYTANGELRVACTTSSNGTATITDMLGLAYDQSGTLIWATPYTYAPSANEMLFGAEIDSSGKIYFAGSDYFGAVLTCINANGTTGWRNKWLGQVIPHRDVFFDVRVDNNGGLYVAGKGIFPGPNYFGNGGTDNAIIVKYTEAGDSLWTYRIYDSLSVSACAAIDVVNGKVYGGGFKADTADYNFEHFIAVLDTAGSTLHEWQYNGKGDGVATGAFVRTDALNNVYCASTVDRFDNAGYDVAIVKYDAAGVQQWERYYSSPVWNNDTLVAMEFDPAGDLLLCIATDSAKTNTKYYPSVVRMNTNGQFSDTVSYTALPGTNIFPRAMMIRTDGSVVLGNAASTLGGLLLYYDANFNLQWTARIDSNVINARVNSLATFPNGDIAMGGYVQTSPSFSDAKGVVQRYTPTGQIVWSADVDSVGYYDDLIDVAVNAAGDVAAVSASGNTIAVAGINGSTGVNSWRQVYNPTTTTERPVEVQYTPAGNIAFICTGYNGFVHRYTTVQYSGTGVFQWATVFSLTASDREPTAMMTDANNNIITAGYKIVSTTSNFDYVLVAYNSSGVQIWLNTYTSTGFTTQNPDRLRSFTRDAAGNYIVTGESSNESFNNWHYRMVTIKYGSSPVGIEELTPVTFTDNVFAYPNPSVNGKFQLADASPNSPISVGSVYDLQGRFLKSLTLQEEVIDLSDMQPGVYFLHYQRNKIDAGTLKLVVE